MSVQILVGRRCDAEILWKVFNFFSDISVLLINILKIIS